MALVCTNPSFSHSLHRSSGTPASPSNPTIQHPKAGGTLRGSQDFFPAPAHGLQSPFATGTLEEGEVPNVLPPCIWAASWLLPSLPSMHHRPVFRTFLGSCVEVEGAGMLPLFCANKPQFLLWQTHRCSTHTPKGLASSPTLIPSGLPRFQG